MKKWIIIASVIFSLAILGGAVFIASNRSTDGDSEGVAPVKTREVSKAELARSDGKNGAPCFVAVDGTVYEMKDLPNWSDGTHKPSEGQAYCGADMTAMIEKSPHGRKMLEQTDKIGPLQK